MSMTGVSRRSLGWDTAPSRRWFHSTSLALEYGYFPPQMVLESLPPVLRTWFALPLAGIPGESKR